MKKIFNLLAIAMIAVLAFSINTVNAQTPLWSETFDGITGGTQQCGANGSAFNATTFASELPQWSYENSNKVYPALGKIKLGTSSVDGFIETLPIDLGFTGSVLITFDAKAWNGSSSSSTMLVYVNGVENLIEGLPFVPSTDTTTAGFCDMATFQIHGATAADGTITLKFQGQPRVFIDNIAIYADNAPAWGVHSAGNFNEIGANETRTVNYTVQGYNLNANETTSISLLNGANFSINVENPVANTDLLEGITIPVTFTGAPVAGSYSDGLILANSQLNDTLPFTATVIEITEISTIAELRTHIDLNDVNANANDSAIYKYTGRAYVTQQFANGNKWIQDATGAIQLYDPENHLSNVSVEMEITNIIGHLCNYYGYAELNVHDAISAADINIFPDAAPDTLVVTLAELQDVDFMRAHQAELTRIDGVTFSATGEFVKMMRYEVSQNGVADSAVYFTSASDTHVGSAIPTGAGNVLGVNMLTNAYSNGSGTPRVGYARYYLLPKQFIGFATGINENEIAMVKVFPNPTTNDVNVVMPENTAVVAVYNMMGELVDAQSVIAGENTVHMSHLTTGMYYLCFMNGTQILGTAKVVKK